MEYDKITLHYLRDLSELRVICIGIKPNHAGFDYLADCVALKVANGDAKLKSVYAEVGRNRNVKAATVADGIYYALRHTSGLRENLERKYEVEIDDSDLFAGFVISLLAKEIRQAYFGASQGRSANG